MLTIRRISLVGVVLGEAVIDVKDAPAMMGVLEAKQHISLLYTLTVSRRKSVDKYKTSSPVYYITIVGEKRIPSG